MRAPLFAAFLLLTSGCLSAVESPAGESAADSWLQQPIVQSHDHEDASLHVGSANMELVAWDPLIPEELGTEGFAGMRIVGELAYLATDGAHAGFLIVNVSDPRSPTLVSQYATAGGASQEAVPSWDGNWVFLNLQRQPGATDFLADPARGTGLGIQVIDVSDKANPRFESFTPVEQSGSHVMFYFEWDGVPHLVYNGQPTRREVAEGQAYTSPVGNVVHVARFEDVGGTMRLVPVSEFRYDGGLLGTTSQGCFPHDMWIEEHPVTGRLVMYVAHWDCGLLTVDVTDPARPALLGVYDDLAPSTRNRIHFARPDPTLRDERVIAWSGPEIDQSPGEPGYLRAYDVTDPARIAQVGTWRLPGQVENDMPFVFSPHNFDFRGDLLAVAHYHAGVWVLDVSDPANARPIGYYLPHGAEDSPYEGEVWRKTPNFPIPYLPNVYEAKWFTSPTDGETYLLVSERGTGLYVLQLRFS